MLKRFPDGPELNRLERELVIGGIAREEIEKNSRKIKELADWVVSDTGGLEGLADVEVDDSFSQQGSLNDNIHLKERNKNLLEEKSVQELRLAAMENSGYDSTWLNPASPRAAQIQPSPNDTITGRAAIEVSKHDAPQPGVKILIIDDGLSRKFRVRSVVTSLNSNEK